MLLPLVLSPPLAPASLLALALHLFLQNEQGFAKWHGIEFNNIILNCEHDAFIWRVNLMHELDA